MKAQGASCIVSQSERNIEQNKIVMDDTVQQSWRELNANFINASKEAMGMRSHSKHGILSQ